MRKMNPFTAVQEIERSLLRVTCDGKSLEIHLSPVNISPAQMADLIDNSGDVTTAKDLVADLADQNERLKLELKEANEALRSAYSVAIRSGVHTDWPNFSKRLENILHRQHLFMYPNRYASKDPQPISHDEITFPSGNWVTQDRVGARDSDEFRWSSNVALGDFRWRKVGNHPGVRGVIHGTTYPGGDTFELRCRPDELPPVITGKQIKEAAERSREKPSPVPFGTVGTITADHRQIKVAKHEPNGVTAAHLDGVTADNMNEATRVLSAWLGLSNTTAPVFYDPKDTTLLLTVRHGSVCYSIDFDGNMTNSVNWHGDVTKQLTPSDALHRLRAVLRKARKDLDEPKELEFTYDWPDRVGIWAVKQSGAGHHQHFWLQMPTELDITHRPERSNYKYAFICPLPVVKH